MLLFNCIRMSKINFSHFTFIFEVITNENVVEFVCSITSCIFSTVS